MEAGSEEEDLVMEDLEEEDLVVEKVETTELVDLVELVVDLVVEEKAVVKVFPECLEVDLVEVEY